MGLDMYAWRVAKEDAIDDFEIAKTGDFIKTDELFYWRKHHDLHGWMENLYREKGGTEECFNCVQIRLNEEDLIRLEKDILMARLPQTTGFFFGTNPPDEESNQMDFEFIRKAREVLANGDAVYYDSWW
jgi:hypothetical protein